MSFRRVYVRFNMDNENDMRLWEYIHSQHGRSVSNVIKSAISDASQGSQLSKTLSNAVAQAIKSANISFAQELDAPAAEDMDNILSFLEGM